MDFSSNGFRVVSKLAENRDLIVFSAIKSEVPYTIKFPKSDLGESLILREAIVLRLLSLSANCPKFVDLLNTGPRKSLVLEFIPGFSLEKLPYLGVSHERTLEALKALVSGVKSIHSVGIIHNDIKPENIILNPENGGIHLIDFGHSDYLNKTYVYKENFIGTPMFLAPEAFLGRYSESSDIYSLGVTAYWLFEFGYPFSSTNLKELFFEKKHPRIKFSRNITLDLAELIRRMLNPDPKGRPSLVEIEDYMNLAIRKKAA
ncbi:MAG: protein kinase [Deltaproteobacteria bacterium]|nr:protein kinase [Deltaproteobacteria bacterium]